MKLFESALISRRRRFVRVSWDDLMAAYLFSAKVISRALGSSAVGATAYRTASCLPNERLGRSHDFSNNAGVVHSEIIAPDDRARAAA